jgi:hypothetical protein
LVGTTKVYPGVGADIVMESISLIVLMGRGMSVTARERQLLEIFHLKDVAHDYLRAPLGTPPQIRTCASLFLTSATITNKPRMREYRVAQERGLSTTPAS